nr:BON domain-containing protein [Azospirillum oleiclasticum]
MRRSALTDAENITVSATGGTVTIGGIVRTWQERELALGTAWSTPGVQCVEDLIVIRP